MGTGVFTTVIAHGGGASGIHFHTATPPRISTIGAADDQLLRVEFHRDKQDNNIAQLSGEGGVLLPDATVFAFVLFLQGLPAEKKGEEKVQRNGLWCAKIRSSLDRQEN